MSRQLFNEFGQVTQLPPHLGQASKGSLLGHLVPLGCRRDADECRIIRHVAHHSRLCPKHNTISNSHVVGHTDSQGSEMHNLQLSIGRAEAVADHLRRRGIALERLSADGRGEADPLTSNASETGRARNRRVELQLRAMP